MVFVDGDHWFKSQAAGTQGRFFIFQHLTDEFIRDKEEHDAKGGVEELFNDGSTFTYENTGTLLKVKGAMRGMPDLAAFHDIGDIAVPAPDIHLFFLQWAVVHGDQGFPAIKLAEDLRKVNDIEIEVTQRKG